MKTRQLLALLLAAALTCPATAQDPDDETETVVTKITGGRVVGVGDNLGRDKKATVLNYVLYGGRTYQADGRPTLVLHKIERAAPRSELLGSDPVRNSFIISYQYVDPKIIYLQGAWMEILEFNNTHLRFKVLDRKPIGAPD